MAHNPSRTLIRTLRWMGLLGTPGSPALQQICELAASLFTVPIAIVTLADEHNLWFKARVGLDACSLEKEGSLCGQVIANQVPLIISDLLADPVHSSNALTSPPSNIRFYAGVPLLLNDDQCIGTLCILDTRSRTLSESQLGQLMDLAKLASADIARQQVEWLYAAERERSSKRNKIIKKLRADYDRQSRKLLQTERLAKVGTWEVNLKTGRHHWSDEVRHIHEVSSDYKPTSSKALKFYPTDVREHVLASMMQAVQEAVPFEYEMPLTTAHGSRRWVRAIGEPELEKGVPVRLIGTVQDVTDRHEVEEHIRHVANHDAVTGLPNRTLFQDRLSLALALAKRNECRVALLLLDLDHFKEVNDGLGHEAGDCLLEAISNRLRTSIRQSDTVARLGGDEFAVILSQVTTASGVGRVADSILKAVSEPFEYRGERLMVGASIGIAVYPDDDDDPQSLLKNADIALYQAKGRGRNRYCFFRPGMRAAIEGRRETLRAVKEALGLGQLELYYQPQVRLATGEISTYEALLRWNHPDRGLLTPGTFAEALDDPSLSKEIGTFVLDTALEQMSQWRKDGIPYGRVAINLSNRQIHDARFAQHLLEQMELKNIPPDSFELEVTETIFLGRQIDHVQRTLMQLNTAGVRIALDDFGTGFASLTHLKKFPVHKIKIDRSFVAGLPGDQDSASIVKAIINLAYSLGHNVVAEGVETPEQAQTLRELGCPFAQGYLFGHPMSAQDIARRAFEKSMPAVPSTYSSSPQRLTA